MGRRKRKLEENLVADGEHLIWTGPSWEWGPVVDLKNHRSVRRELWLRLRGEEVPMNRTLRPKCGRSDCVLPGHQELIAFKDKEREVEERPYAPTVRDLDQARRIYEAHKDGGHSYAAIGEALGLTRQRAQVIARRYEEHLAATGDG